MGARWWSTLPKPAKQAGTANTTAPVTASIRDFGAAGCSTVWLTGGRSVTVLSGTAPAGCKATWSAAPGGKGALLTAASAGSPPLWQVHLPADGRPARLTCGAGAACPLVSDAAPCTPAQASGLVLPSAGAGTVTTSSFAKALAGAENTCRVGSAAPEGDAPWPTPAGTPLSYGLSATFYSQVYGEAECASPTPWSWWGVPPAMEAGPSSAPRCVPGVDFRGTGASTWRHTGEPALDPDAYSSCFGAAFAGWVKLPSAYGLGGDVDSLTWWTGPPPPSTPTPPPQTQQPPRNPSALDSAFRVCVRYTSQVEIVLAGSPVALASPDPRVDLTYACQDLTLESAREDKLVPLSIRFASPPIDDLTVLQLWVIPAVAEYANPEGGMDTVFDCDACTPLSPVADLCCPPLGSCAYRSVCGEGVGGGGGTPTPEPTVEQTPPGETTTPPPSDTTAPPEETTPPPETTAPPTETTTAPPTPPPTTPPPETTTPGGYGGYGTTTPPPPETTTPPPPETTAPGGYGGYGTTTPPPETTTPPETTAPPTPGPTCPPDRLGAAARRDWEAFQSAAAAASGPDELELLVELFAGKVRR